MTQELCIKINSDIDDINKNMISISDKYIEEKLRYFLYDIYNFRKSFVDNNLNKLLNDFILIIENNENKFYQFN